MPLQFNKDRIADVTVRKMRARRGLEVPQRGAFLDGALISVINQIGVRQCPPRPVGHDIHGQPDRRRMPNIEARIVREVDASHFRRITDSTLEGLAKRELNLGAIVGKSAEARERRLIPEVIEELFTTAAPLAGVKPRPVQKDSHVYRVGKIPEPLRPDLSAKLPATGKVGKAGASGEIIRSQAMFVLTAAAAPEGVHFVGWRSTGGLQRDYSYTRPAMRALA
jgi:hypothetical protein